MSTRNPLTKGPWPPGAAVAVMTRGYAGNEFWRTGDIVELCEPCPGHWSGTNILAYSITSGGGRDAGGGYVEASRFRPLTPLAAALLQLAEGATDTPVNGGR